MDYQRIYGEFIADRRINQPGEDEYVEVHHILPRCMGGSDDPDNLIRLTPEDHFFAHLLLAKAHGGKLASALFLMTVASDSHWGRRFSTRRAYGLGKRIAVRLLSENWSGDGNPLFNDTVFEWVNYRTGEKCHATIYDMHSTYGGSRPSWTMVVDGSKASVNGWLLSDRASSHQPHDKGVVFEFVNRNGKTFVGTQKEFCSMSGLSAPAAFRVVKAGAVTKSGWRLSSTPDRHFNATRDGRPTGSFGTGKTLTLLHKDGRKFVGTTGEFKLYLGLPTNFAMSPRISAVKHGKCRSWRGWMLDPTNDNQAASVAA